VYKGSSIAIEPLCSRKSPITVR